MFILDIKANLITEMSHNHFDEKAVTVLLLPPYTLILKCQLFFFKVFSLGCLPGKGGRGINSNWDEGNGQ